MKNNIRGNTMQPSYQPDELYPALNGPIVKEQQPLQRALNEHGEQLDKLGALLSNLEDRLHSIRNSSPTAEDSVGVSERAGSAVFNQVSAQTTGVKQ